jgi:hypothetical protein
MVIGVAGADHRRTDIAQGSQIAFTDGTAGLNHGSDAPIQQVDQTLRELRTRRVVGHGVGANDHHGADDFLLVDFGRVSHAGAELEVTHLRPFQVRLVVR